MKGIILVVLLGITYGAPVEQDIVCGVCQLLVENVQTMVKQQHTQVSVRDYVTDICSRLPGDNKDTCLTFVKDNSDMFFSKMITDLNPTQFCNTLPDMCPGENVVVQKLPLVVTMPDNVEGPLECELCKLAVLGVDKLIGTNRSVAAINSTLEKFCLSLPEKLKGICTDIEPLILKGLSQGIEPDIVCKIATLCTASNGQIEDVSEIPCDICLSSMDAIGIQNPEHVCAPIKTCQEVILPENVQSAIECQICKFAVEALDKLIGQNKSMEAINSTLEQLCNDLPGTLKEDCIKIEPTILKAAVTGLDPTEACDLVKACSSYEGKPSSITYVSCKVCQDTLEAVAGKEGLELCDQLNGMCNNDNEPTPVEAINNVEQQEGVKDDLECQLCKLFVEAIDVLVGDNRSVAAINSTLEKFCMGLSGELSSICFFIEPQLLKAATGGLPPALACDFIKACNEGVTVTDISCDVCKETLEGIAGDKGIEMCYHIPDVCEPQMKTLDEVVEAIQVNADARCELCTFVVTLLDEFIKQNASLERINATLYQICGSVPENLRATCYGLAPVLEGIIGNGLDPMQSCIAAAFCTNGTDTFEQTKMPCDTCRQTVDKLTPIFNIPEDVADALCSESCPGRSRRSADSVVFDISEITKAAKQLEKKGGNVGGFAECELCKVAITTLDGLAGENASIEMVNATMYDICIRLSGKQLVDMCLSQYPKLIAIMEAGGLSADTVCKTVGLCAADDHTLRLKRSVSNIKPELETVGSVECDLCLEVVEYLDTLLEDNATEEMINETLLRLCSGLPFGALQDICKNAAPEIMKTLEAGFDAKKTCDAAGLCDDSVLKGRSKMIHMLMTIETTPKQMKKHVAIENPKKPQDLECELCKAVIKEIDTILDNNSTDAEINATVYETCAKLPGALQDVCLQAAPKIVAEVCKGGDPDAVCDTIQMCDRSIVKLYKFTMKSDENLEDIKCDLCEDLVKLADGYIMENATDDKVNATLHQLCSGIPNIDIRDVCMSIIPAIMEKFDGGLDPKQVCSLAKLCNSARVVKTVHEPVQNEGNLKDLKCDVCKAIIKEIDAVLANNETDKQLNETVYQTCAKLPGALQDLCLSAAPQIISTIEKGADPSTTCIQVGLCSAEEGVQKEVVVEENLKDLKCELCEAIIDSIDKVIGTNATKQEINETVYGVCGQLPGALQALCLQYAPQIVNEVAAGADPTKVCAIIKLCTGVPAQTRINVEGNLKDLKCDLCKAIIDGLDSIIGNNATKEQINETVYNLCANLPGSLQDLCLNFAPSIVQVVSSGADPTKACDIIKLCSNNIAQTRQEVEGNLKDLKCELCEAIIDGIDSVIGTNATKEQINETVYTLCADLPGNLQDMCLQYAPQIVQVVSSGADPTKACIIIKLCANDVVVEDKVTVSNPTDPIQCKLCEYLVDGVDSIIKKNRTEAAINSTVYKLCEEVPKNMTLICYLIAPTLVYELRLGMNPAQACKDIKMCPTTEEASTHLIESKIQRELQSMECEMCMTSLQFVYDDLAGNYEKIRRPLLNLCNNMPEPFKSQCETTISADNGVFFKQFMSGYTPTALCEMAKCTESDGLSRELNRSK